MMWDVQESITCRDKDSPLPSCVEPRGCQLHSAPAVDKGHALATHQQRRRIQLDLLPEMYNPHFCATRLKRLQHKSNVDDWLRLRWFSTSTVESEAPMLSTSITSAEEDHEVRPGMCSSYWSTTRLKSLQWHEQCIRRVMISAMNTPPSQ